MQFPMFDSTLALFYNTSQSNTVHFIFLTIDLPEWSPPL